ncbi:MAG: hypothetical protein HC838_03745 [Spirulinaceae cyanobacterium RM2_2_10]|nr:hypothetical protein [Spirulinaceae cyanobacterium RM2_2_10]
MCRFTFEDFKVFENVLFAAGQLFADGVEGFLYPGLVEDFTVDRVVDLKPPLLLRHQAEHP